MRRDVLRIACALAALGLPAIAHAQDQAGPVAEESGASVSFAVPISGL